MLSKPYSSKEQEALSALLTTRWLKVNKVCCVSHFFFFLSLQSIEALGNPLIDWFSDHVLVKRERSAIISARIAGEAPRG
jgi:hypothetical protein